LFRANKIYAYYVSAQKHVVISADVIVNPVADDVHICPNPVAMPPAREFIVAGTTKPGIQPMLVTVRRVSTSFLSDLTPKSVIVYSAGIDGPVREEVPVSAPPPPLDPHVHLAQPDPKPSNGPVEVTGYSPTYSLEEAVQDALAQAAVEFPAPPRNPDVAVEIDIKDIFARAGGNIRPGLFVRASAK
jgi:hypothetical protein